MLGYRVPAPDQAMLISGGRSRRTGAPFKVVVGHGTFVAPFFRKTSFLTLSMCEAEVAETCVTRQGISLNVRAVIAFKVGNDEESIVNAGQRFLSDQDQMSTLTGRILQGRIVRGWILRAWLAPSMPGGARGIARPAPLFLVIAGVLCPPGRIYRLRGIPSGWSRVVPLAERRPRTGAWHALVSSPLRGRRHVRAGSALERAGRGPGPGHPHPHGAAVAVVPLEVRDGHRRGGAAGPGRVWRRAVGQAATTGRL